MLNKIFKLTDRSTSVTSEVLAGFTTFVTMAYVLAVMPSMLAGTGMDKEAVFVATCLSAGLVTILMGFTVNLPIALAPGMGLGAYFAAIAAEHTGTAWQIALGAVFISGVIFLILTLTKIRQVLVEAIPDSLKHALVAGIGLFIAIIGFKMSALVTLNIHLGPSLNGVMSSHGAGSLKFFEWDLVLGNFASPDILLALIGLVITSILLVMKVRGAILLGIIITTLIGIPLGVTDISGVHFGLPKLTSFNLGAMDLKSAFNWAMASLIFTFTFVGLIDTFATLVSTAHKAKLLDKSKESSAVIGKAMTIDSIGACFGAFLGVPTLTVYLESMSGISAGGRTGLTALVVGMLFLLSLVLSSLFIVIPNAATAPVLIIIGSFMLGAIKDIDFEDFTEGLPAFLTIVLMPFTYSIANGISAGVIFYVLLKLVSRRMQEIHWMLYLLALLVVLRFWFF